VSGNRRASEIPSVYDQSSWVWDGHATKKFNGTESVAVCRYCRKELRCTKGNTTGISSHLSTKHSVYKNGKKPIFTSKRELSASVDTTTNADSSNNEVISLTDSSGTEPPAEKRSKTQPNIAEALTNVKKWDFHSRQAEHLTRLVGEFIVADYQSFNIVESEAFKRLILALEARFHLPGKSHFSEKCIPKIFSDIEQLLKVKMRDIATFSFTTDTWSDTTSGISLISLTVHGVNEKFERVNLVIGANGFSNLSHTGVNIADKVISMKASSAQNHSRCGNEVEFHVLHA